MRCRFLLLCLEIGAFCGFCALERVSGFDQPVPGNVFLEGSRIGFSAARNAVPGDWKIVDHRGSVVAEGKFDGNKIDASPLPLGHYRLMLLSSNRVVDETDFAILSSFTPPKASPFGVQGHFAQRWSLNLVPLIRAMGVSYVRDDIYWATVEKSRGAFDFARSDEYVRALNRSGLRTLLMLGFENPCYDNGDTPWTEAGRNAYANYAAAVVERYAPDLTTVEIWNEYVGTWCKGPATANRSAHYARMLRAAHRRIKSVRPEIVVAGCSTAGIPWPFLEKLFKEGTLQYMDAVSVHPYRSNETPEGIDDDIRRLDRLIRRYNGGQGKSIWATEYGWYIKNPREPGDLLTRPSDQAAFLVRAAVLMLSAGVSKMSWYAFKDHSENALCGLIAEPRPGIYTPRPAYVAYAVLARKLSSATFTSRDATPADVYSLLFKDDSRAIRVLWSLQPTHVSIDTKDQVSMTGMMGAGETLSPDSGVIYLTLSPEPIYLEGDALSVRVTSSPKSPTGPLPTIADSTNDFSLAQGTLGWWYGWKQADSPLDFIGGEFFPAKNPRETDWTVHWTDRPAWFSVSRSEQHPGIVEGKSIIAVRRWVSPLDGRLRVQGKFKKAPGGDGVEAALVVDGSLVWHTKLGGGASIRNDMDLVQEVTRGTILDFQIAMRNDPTFDATRMAITISKASEK